MHGGHTQQDASRGALPAPPASVSHADVTNLLASQPAPAMPEHLMGKVSDAIAAESARLPVDSRLAPAAAAAGSQLPARASVRRLPRPRSGMPLQRFDVLVPRPRAARSAA